VISSDMMSVLNFFKKKVSDSEVVRGDGHVDDVTSVSFLIRQEM